MHQAQFKAERKGFENVMQWVDLKYDVFKIAWDGQN